MIGIKMPDKEKAKRTPGEKRKGETPLYTLLRIIGVVASLGGSGFAFYEFINTALFEARVLAEQQQAAADYESGHGEVVNAVEAAEGTGAYGELLDIMESMRYTGRLGNTVNITVDRMINVGMDIEGVFRSTYSGYGEWPLDDSYVFQVSELTGEARAQYELLVEVSRIIYSYDSFTTRDQMSAEDQARLVEIEVQDFSAFHQAVQDKVSNNQARLQYAYMRLIGRSPELLVINTEIDAVQERFSYLAAPESGELLLSYRWLERRVNNLEAVRILPHTITESELYNWSEGSSVSLSQIRDPELQLTDPNYLETSELLPMSERRLLLLEDDINGLQEFKTFLTQLQQENGTAAQRELALALAQIGLAILFIKIKTLANSFGFFNRLDQRRFRSVVNELVTFCLGVIATLKLKPVPNQSVREGLEKTQRTFVLLQSWLIQKVFKKRGREPVSKAQTDTVQDRNSSSKQGTEPIENEVIEYEAQDQLRKQIGK